MSRVLVLPVLMGACALLLLPELAPAGNVVVEDFETGKLTWERRRPLTPERPEYSIEEEDGKHFLHAVAQPGIEGKQIYKRFVIDLEKTPVLRWRWRALALPENGNEGVRGTNDSAAGVYVLLQKGPLRRILKYCWSSTRRSPEWITSLSSNWFWKTRMKALRTGSPLNVWVEESVDLRKDFREAFGSDAPGRAEGIGVLTDGDQTRSLSSADYADFRAVPPASEGKGKGPR